MGAQTNIGNMDAENVTFTKKLKCAPTTKTLTGNLTLTVDDTPLQFLDPGGAGRDVTLPAVASSKGLFFIISNEADALEILTVKDAAAATIVTPTQNEACIVFCDGTTWSGLVGATS